MINTVAIYCGARDGDSLVFQQQAEYMGLLLAKNNFSLVYGDGNVGLMKRLADSFLDARRVYNSDVSITGVITNDLLEIEDRHPGVDKTLYTDSLPLRQHRMAKIADAFVLLPGGMGSMFEIVEQILYKSLGYHDKPIVIVNIFGYWNSFIDLYIEMVDRGFIDENKQVPFNVVLNSYECVELLNDLKSSNSE